MSRSYRKHPGYKLQIQGGKRASARKVRRYRRAIPNGAFYKKIYNSYNVIDYVFLAVDSDTIRTFQRYLEIGRYLRKTLPQKNFAKNLLIVVLQDIISTNKLHILSILILFY